MPRGGPDGGDGGRGGDVVLVCDDSLRDLQHFRRRAQFRAKRGGHGGARRATAPTARRCSCACRPGPRCVARRADLHGRRYDLVTPGQHAVVARGGSGGRGNKRFATATRQAPRFAERGVPGEEGWLSLQLKLLADVGLVGLPNAGKSSLISRLTRAAPKVADYPFTTLSRCSARSKSDDRQLVVADIPGLIEGASEGAGLGHDFLAHVERTRLLVHVLDLAPELQRRARCRRAVQLRARSSASCAPTTSAWRGCRGCSRSPRPTSSPAERAREEVAQWSRRLGPDVPVLATSSATGTGLDELASGCCCGTVPAAPPAPPPRSRCRGAEGLAEHRCSAPPRGAAFASSAAASIPSASRGGDRASRAPVRRRQRGRDGVRRGAPAADRRAARPGGAGLPARRRDRDRRDRLRARSERQVD